MVPDSAPKHRITIFERIQNRGNRDRGSDLKCYLAAYMR